MPLDNFKRDYYCSYCDRLIGRENPRFSLKLIKLHEATCRAKALLKSSWSVERVRFVNKRKRVA